MMNNIETFRNNINQYGKGSLPKNKRYHIVLKDFSGDGIHCSYLKGYNNEILWLMDSRNSIIAEVYYKDIEEITVCKDNFWDVLYTVYSKE